MKRKNKSFEDNNKILDEMIKVDFRLEGIYRTLSHPGLDWIRNMKRKNHRDVAIRELDISTSI